MRAAPSTAFLFGEAAWAEDLDTCRITDEALAEAYDATPPPLRGCIKNTLALTHAVYGEHPDTLERRSIDTARGVARATRAEPAPWAVVAFTPAYAAGPRLAAALMPALLAHVPLLGAVCVGGRPSAAARVVLELAGVEDAFCLDQAYFSRLLRDMRRCGVGRLALLHRGELASLRDEGAALRMPVWEEARPPRLLIAAGSGHERSHIAWGHPDAHLTEISAQELAAGPDVFLPGIHEVDAIFCDPEQEAPSLDRAPLVLLPGMEGCWLHTDLSPMFFTRTATALGTATPSIPFL